LYLYTKETTSKDIDESYRNITFQLYHIKAGFSTLFVEICLKELLKTKFTDDDKRKIRDLKAVSRSEK